MCFCVGLGCYSLGLFTALFLIAWDDERQDTRAGIPWSKDLGTSFNWDTRLGAKGRGAHAPTKNT
jgi:hypothetical protein